MIVKFLAGFETFQFNHGIAISVDRYLSVLQRGVIHWMLDINYYAHNTFRILRSGLPKVVAEVCKEEKQ